MTFKNIKELYTNRRTKVIGKGGRLRVVYTALNPIQLKVYETIIDRVHRDEEVVLNYTIRHLRRKFKELQEKVLLFNWPFPAPHALRRASGRAMFPTTDIYHTMARLGHKNPKTTHTYLKCHDDSILQKLDFIEQQRYEKQYC